MLCRENGSCSARTEIHGFLQKTSCLFHIYLLYLKYQSVEGKNELNTMGYWRYYFERIDKFMNMDNIDVLNEQEDNMACDKFEF